VICEECGDIVEKYPCEVKDDNYCSQECLSESRRDRVTVHCAFCSSEITRIKSDINEENNFCNQDCLNQYKTQKASVELECDWCGEMFTVKQSYTELDQGVYCSSECGYSYISEARTKEENHGYKNCHECGKRTRFHKNKIERNERFFCSEECSNEWRSEYMRGRENPSWDGGYERYYGSNWQEQRKKALERDNYKCVRCGIRNEEHQKTQGRSLHIHHIKPFSKFDGYKLANELTNLTSVCTNCHSKIELLSENEQRKILFGGSDTVNGDMS